jgi:hypothetical protein
MSISFTADVLVARTLSSLQSVVALQVSSASNAIALAAQRCQDLQLALGQLGKRCSAVGQPVDAAAIRAALEQGKSLDAVFAADPASLAGKLVDATALADSLKRAGLDAGLQLLYPVLVSRTGNGDTTERLVWMTAAQRMALDSLSPSPDAGIPGCPGFSETGKDGATSRYCCLDAYRTLRIPGSTVQAVFSNASVALRDAGSDMDRMVAAFTKSALQSEQGLSELLALLETAMARGGKRLE